MNQKNILVIGFNEFNLKELETIENAGAYSFIPIFKSGIQEQEEIDVEGMVAQARKEIEKENREIHAIISYFDFPFTLITFMLCEEYGLTGPTLAQGLKCEHKYWSRSEQQKAIPEHVPNFEAINPFDAPAFDDLKVNTPFWIKPVKGFSSQLGYKIENAQQYQESLQVFREEIERLAKPFNYFLEHANLPEEVAAIDGHYCLAEESIFGHQCTISGYVYDREVHSYGLIDSEHYEGTTSFFYYLVPSTLPQGVQKRMEEITRKVMKQLGFNNSPFNIEFFYDKEKDTISLLEINPRMSQSHAEMYHQTHGHSNHQVLVKLATGEKPHFRNLEGKYEYAAKIQYRVFEDGRIKSVPDSKKIKALEEKYDDTIIKIDVEEGQKLSEIPLQDSYSYSLGVVMTAANSKEELLQKYDQIIDELKIEIE